MNTGNINIKDIARLAGVGVATVSRVINNTGEVKEATQKRVQEIIKEYNYVPNNSARNLKRSQSNTVCVLMKGIANPVFNDMLSIIQKKSIENHYNISKTASDLHIHRNTMMNYMARIQELLPYNIGQPENRLKLQIGIHAMYLLDKQNES